MLQFCISAFACILLRLCVIIRLETWLRPNTGFVGVYAFDYNSAESEPIWMKSGALLSTLSMTGLADFRRDPRSNDSLRGRRNFVFFCQLNNSRFHRFPVGQLSQNLNTTTSIGVAMKTFAIEF